MQSPSSKRLKLSPGDLPLTYDEFSRDLKQILSFSWLLYTRNEKTALYQLIDDNNDCLEFHVRITIMQDLKMKVVLGKNLVVESSQLEYWWQLKEVLQKYDQNMKTGVLDDEFLAQDVKIEPDNEEG